MLYAVPALDGDDNRVLGEIESLHAAFLQFGRAGEWVGGVRKRLFASAIRGSNTIEGYTVSPTAATAIVDHVAVPADVPEEAREAVRGYRDALTWVTQTADMASFAYSETALSALHFMMMRFWPERAPGRYRTRGIVVTGADPLVPAYVGPDADRIPGLMSELVDWLNAGDLAAHLLVRAAMAHLNLVRVHPWRDGNGRMSRCLQTMVIARGGRLAPEFCSIEEWLGFELNTVDYYRALQETGGTYEPATDVHSWVRFCLRAHHLQAQIVDRRLRYGQEVWAALAELVAGSGFHARTVAALYAAATDHLRREIYAGAEGLSRDQSVRDVRALERAGLLTAVGYGATLAYVAAGPAREIADQVAAGLTAPAREPYGR
ncbi:Fic family protein [Asanoa sp. WMMD1127]|uniref:Fic family protein n=1 Tax=Asanoa sp. WMMD1127 TaxID=3016107 RepID=UPI0024172A23|nr:Fic family protein [Asanoa sp. WMMD1127]MDG4823760.1 Fic family protein [Asanoa sp. WMMD1127]